MTKTSKALAVLAVATLGLWGCAEGPASRTANLERAKALEARNAKLEEEYRTAKALREQLNKKLTTVEAEHAALQEELNQIRQASAKDREALRQEVNQLKAAARERDELRREVKVRAHERDALQNQFEQFRKNIRELLGQVDAAALATPAQPNKG
jgi:chromosome segregation ATPase